MGGDVKQRSGAAGGEEMVGSSTAAEDDPHIGNASPLFPSQVVLARTKSVSPVNPFFSTFSLCLKENASS